MSQHKRQNLQGCLTGPGPRLGRVARLGLQVGVRKQRLTRASAACRDQSASSAEEGQEASDISQRFTEHLDRNMPALLLITLV